MKKRKEMFLAFDRTRDSGHHDARGRNTGDEHADTSHRCHRIFTDEEILNHLILIRNFVTRRCLHNVHISHWHGWQAWILWGA